MNNLFLFGGLGAVIVTVVIIVVVIYIKKKKERDAASSSPTSSTPLQSPPPPPAPIGGLPEAIETPESRDLANQRNEENIKDKQQTAGEAASSSLNVTTTLQGVVSTGLTPMGDTIRALQTELGLTPSPAGTPSRSPTPVNIENVRNYVRKLLEDYRLLQSLINSAIIASISASYSLYRAYKADQKTTFDLVELSQQVILNNVNAYKIAAKLLIEYCYGPNTKIRKYIRENTQKPKDLVDKINSIVKLNTDVLALVSNFASGNGYYAGNVLTERDEKAARDNKRKEDLESNISKIRKVAEQQIKDVQANAATLFRSGIIGLMMDKTGERINQINEQLTKDISKLTLESNGAFESSEAQIANTLKQKKQAAKDMKYQAEYYRSQLNDISKANQEIVATFTGTIYMIRKYVLMVNGTCDYLPPINPTNPYCTKEPCSPTSEITDGYLNQVIANNKNIKSRIGDIDNDIKTIEEFDKITKEISTELNKNERTILDAAGVPLGYDTPPVETIITQANNSRTLAKNIVQEFENQRYPLSSITTIVRDCMREYINFNDTFYPPNVTTPGSTTPSSAVPQNLKYSVLIAQSNYTKYYESTKQLLDTTLAAMGSIDGVANQAQAVVQAELDAKPTYVNMGGGMGFTMPSVNDIKKNSPDLISLANNPGILAIANHINDPVNNPKPNLAWGIQQQENKAYGVNLFKPDGSKDPAVLAAHPVLANDPGNRYLYLDPSLAGTIQISDWSKAGRPGSPWPLPMTSYLDITKIPAYINENGALFDPEGKYSDTAIAHYKRQPQLWKSDGSIDKDALKDYANLYRPLYKNGRFNVDVLNYIKTFDDGEFSSIFIGGDITNFYATDIQQFANLYPRLFDETGNFKGSDKFDSFGNPK
jgi:hypothetical protein